MTHEEKQAYLACVLPKIAKAVWPQFDDWEYDNFDVWSDEYGGPVDLLNDDRDSAYMRRRMQIDVEWHDGAVVCVFRDSKNFADYFAEPHDGTPDSMGEAERWAVLQAAAKKLGLE